LNVPQRIGVFEWQKAVCSEHGLSNSVARLILMVISLHMDPDGSNAFPSQETIAERAKVTTRSVVTHVGKAVRLGWLRKYTAGRTGQGWHLNGYEATVPDDVYPLLKRSERPSPRPKAKRSERVSAPSAERGETDSTNVMNMKAEVGERDSHYLSLLTSPITKEGAAPPSPAEAGSAAPERMHDESLRGIVRTMRLMRWTDEEILKKHAKYGMTAAHLTDGNPGSPT
jgi:hypothetical protein